MVSIMTGEHMSVRCEDQCYLGGGERTSAVWSGGEERRLFHGKNYISRALPSRDPWCSPATRSVFICMHFVSLL